MTDIFEIMKGKPGDSDYENNLIDLPVFSRLKGTESEKAKEMLQGSRTNIFDSVEDAINAAVMGIKK